MDALPQNHDSPADQNLIKESFQEKQNRTSYRDLPHNISAGFSCTRLKRCKMVKIKGKGIPVRGRECP
jgi:hypothetical protein